MKLDPTPLHGQSILSIEKKDYTWFFRFSGGDVLATESPWRLMMSDGISVTSEDHEHQFGLPSPVDTAKRVSDGLGTDEICEAKHDPQTGDLYLRFTGGRCLHFLQLSCGYEAWRLYMGDREYICMGGGEHASFERVHFTEEAIANKRMESNG